MNYPEYEVIKLFPQLLFKATLPTNLSPITNWLDKQVILTEEKGVNTEEFGERSENVQILNEPECKELSNFILNLTYKYADEHLNYNHKSYIFTQSWISIKQPGQYHATHSHSNSLISGVFYYGEIDINTPGIGFLQTEAPQTYCMLSPKYKNDIKPQYEPHMLSTYPGTLFLFPSYLMHFVPPNTSNIPRKSLAFNIIPSDGFGEDRTLNYLNINNDLK
jgi:uncharacterized protein (TIGR02466 family)